MVCGSVPCYSSHWWGGLSSGSQGSVYTCSPYFSCELASQVCSRRWWGWAPWAHRSRGYLGLYCGAPLRTSAWMLGRLAVPSLMGGLWCQWGYLDLWRWVIWGLEDPESIQVGPLAYLTGLIFFVFCCSYLNSFLPFGFFIYRYSAMIGIADMGSFGPLLCEWLGCTSPNLFWCGGV